MPIIPDPLCNDCGTPGTTGVQGPVGPRGPQGVQGTQGPQGAIGLQGIQGHIGAKGEIGATGIGCRGATGLSGLANFIEADYFPDPIGVTPVLLWNQDDQALFAGVTGVNDWVQISAGSLQGATGLSGVGTTGLQGVTGLHGLTGIKGIANFLDRTDYPVIGPEPAVPAVLMWQRQDEILYAGVTGLNWIQISAGSKQGPTGIAGIPGTKYHWTADSLTSPINSDWAIDKQAPALSDETNASIVIRSFNDSTVLGTGFTAFIPSQTTSILFDTASRANNAPVSTSDVKLKLYNRPINDSQVLSSWSSGTDLTLSFDSTRSNNFAYDSTTMSLTSLGITSNKLVQFELTRETTGNTLTGNWNLLDI